MQKGDYRKFHGTIVQIAGIHSIYTDAVGNVLDNSIDIAVTDAVLLACGFIYDKECSCYELQHNKNRIIIERSRWGGKYCCMICSPKTPPHAPDTINHIVTLTDLQDFVRICTSEELPINVIELANAIK